MTSSLPGACNPDYTPHTMRIARWGCIARFTPREANVYLIVAHHKTEEKGEGYDETSYSATLCVYVPAR